MTGGIAAPPRPTSIGSGGGLARAFGPQDVRPHGQRLPVGKDGGTAQNCAAALPAAAACAAEFLLLLSSSLMNSTIGHPHRLSVLASPRETRSLLGPFFLLLLQVLEQMPPWIGGGEVSGDVHFDHSTYKPPPTRFEAGTLNIAEVIGAQRRRGVRHWSSPAAEEAGDFLCFSCAHRQEAEARERCFGPTSVSDTRWRRLLHPAGLGAASDFLMSIGMPAVEKYEAELFQPLYDQLTAIEGVRVYGPPPAGSARGGDSSGGGSSSWRANDLACFTVEGVDAKELAETLDKARNEQIQGRI